MIYSNNKSIDILKPLKYTNIDGTKEEEKLLLKHACKTYSHGDSLNSLASHIKFHHPKLMKGTLCKNS